MSSQAITGFAIDLYDRLALPSAGANEFYSPLSVSIVLGMAFEGARGNRLVNGREEVGRAGKKSRDQDHKGQSMLQRRLQDSAVPGAQPVDRALLASGLVAQDQRRRHRDDGERHQQRRHQSTHADVGQRHHAKEE